jgi:protein-disulfide isomerase
MHDLLFEGQEEWSGKQNAVEMFQDMAANLGLDQAEFDACLDEGRYADRVAADLQEGISEGVTGTPAFRINGAALSGAQPFAAFQEQIDFFLAGGKPPTLEVAADSFRSIGDANAPVVVTEFSDYQCPACSTVEQQVIPELLSRYVETGKVRFVYREFPLESSHPNARKASEAAVCAGQQDRYWDMHRELFASQSQWSEQADPVDVFRGYAEDLGLDVKAFDTCLDSEEAALAVQEDIVAGQALGVNATPFFFIGELPIRGGLPIEAMGRVIDYVAAGGPTPEIVPPEDDWHLRGNVQTARAVTVAFVDFASPESGEHARDILPQLAQEYIDTGQLIYIIHPWSESDSGSGAQAATAAECAGQQGQYWEMHAELFSEQAAWTEVEEPASLFADYAQQLSLDMEEFETCLDSEWALLRVQAGSVVGALYGVPGAPVFLFNNGQAQQGSPTLEEFETMIDSIINR